MPVIGTSGSTSVVKIAAPAGNPNPFGCGGQKKSKDFVARNAVSLVSVAKCLGPPAMQVHVRCNPPLNARAIAIRMQAPMKPAIK
jgi:hypothetical protein